jgi:hypothetical protein
LSAIAAVLWIVVLAAEALGARHRGTRAWLAR